MNTYKKFSDFDLFGYNVGLYFNGSIKESTLFGFIFTIIYILSLIVVTIYYITETFKRKNYSFSTSTMELENIVSIELNKEIFALSFALENPVTYAGYIDETIYYIKANHITGKRDSVTQDYTWYNEEIKTGPCTLDMFAENNQRFFQNNYKNEYCLYDINKKNLTGNFIFDHYSKIVISFYPCINNTENNNHCKPKNIIDYYLNNTYVGMYLQSSTIDENQIPMTRTYIESPYTTIGQNFFKDYQILLKIVETEDDTGLISKYKKYKKLLQIDETISMFSLNRKINDDSFCEISIALSDKKTVYKREYERIQNAISKAGSIMTLICTIIQFFFWLPVKIFYEVSVINKVFRFDMKKTKNKKMNQNQISSYLKSSDNYDKKSKSNSIELNIDEIKNENEENFKGISKDHNFNFISYKRKSYSHINNFNTKANHHKDLNIKFLQDNSGNILINDELKKRNFNINQISNIYKKSLENNQYKRGKKRNEKGIVDVKKFSCCQLLCYYPINLYSNNNKINLAKNAQNFFRKTLDVISVFQNIVTNQKISKLILKNKKIFRSSEKEIFYNNKPFISDNRIEMNNYN